MLFRAKIAELRRYLLTLSDELETCHLHSYANLVRRGELLKEEVVRLGSRLNQVEEELILYHKPAAVGLDTWPQIFSDLREIAQGIHLLRTLELPAILATTPEDAGFVELLSALHYEIGIKHISPCVTQRQTRWFAVRAFPSDIPLYFIPTSMLGNPHELALIFHEIGHVIYREWDAAIAKRASEALQQVWVSKLHSTRTFSDPSERDNFKQMLQSWYRANIQTLEEVVCDITGTLLGGPAFVLALILGMMGDAYQPFTQSTERYPPLDCRVRICLAVIERQGWTTALPIQPLVDGWNTIRSNAQQTQERWYDRLYDEHFFFPLIDAVAQELRARDVLVYDVNSGGLRERLTQGAIALLDSQNSYSQWADTFRIQINGLFEA